MHPPEAHDPADCSDAAQCQRHGFKVLHLRLSHGNRHRGPEPAATFVLHTRLHELSSRVVDSTSYHSLKSILCAAHAAVALPPYNTSEPNSPSSTRVRIFIFGRTAEIARMMFP